MSFAESDVSTTPQANHMCRRSMAEDRSTENSENDAQYSLDRAPQSAGSGKCRGCRHAMAARNAQAADDTAPIGPIQQLDSALLVAMKAGGNTPFEQRYRTLTPVIEQVFNLQAVLAVFTRSRTATARQPSLSRKFLGWRCFLSLRARGSCVVDCGIRP